MDEDVAQSPVVLEDRYWHLMPQISGTQRTFRNTGQTEGEKENAI
jgi:hypothetical protein